MLFSLNVSAQNWKTTFTTALKNGGALVVNHDGDVLYQHRADEAFVPASTIKVATAAAALYYLGRDHRFVTDFFLSQQNRLAIKGYGDPFLVSEELALIAKALKAKGLKNVGGIIVDNTYFDAGISIDGASQSTNPYDALNGALIANFNTIYVQKSSGGAIVSAEEQTPLTPLARSAAIKLGGGKQRVNLGRNMDIGARYAGELIVAFLDKEGISVSGDVVVGAVPDGATLFYRHESSRTLSDNLKGLLEFSTNFMANQLFLVLGAKKNGAPATVDKGLDALKKFLRTEVGWKNFELAEGAGLSRQNKVTPLEMMMLLNYFEPNRDLLPVKEGVLQVKTGTLTGVNTLVGYFPDKSNHIVKFVIMVNSAVPYDYKFKLGKTLYDVIHGGE